MQVFVSESTTSSMTLSETVDATARLTSFTLLRITEPACSTITSSITSGESCTMGEDWWKTKANVTRILFFFNLQNIGK